MRYAIAAFFGLMLSECVEGGAPPEAAGHCGEDGLQGLVGQPRAAFDHSVAAGPVRVLPPGAMVTMDYRPERLNVELNEDDRITRIWCG